jgi:hypothetical protein
MSRKMMMWAVFASLVAGTMTVQAKAQQEAYQADLQTSSTAGAQNRLQIRITKWSTQDEIKGYGAVLKEKGQAGLLDALKDLDAGRINKVGDTGNQVAVAEKWKNGDKTVITLIVARNMSMFQTNARGMPAKYPFAFVQLTLDANGEGTGRVVEAAGIKYDQDKYTYKLDPFGQGPRVLNNVKPLK